MISSLEHLCHLTKPGHIMVLSPIGPKNCPHLKAIIYHGFSSPIAETSGKQYSRGGTVSPQLNIGRSPSLRCLNRIGCSSFHNNDLTLIHLTMYMKLILTCLLKKLNNVKLYTSLDI
jgi:hypothetical protein